jgi:hypothetical protein
VQGHLGPEVRTGDARARGEEMHPGVRLLIWLGVTCSILGSFVAAYLRQHSALTDIELNPEFAAAVRRTAELMRLEAAIKRNSAAKIDVVGRMLDGQLTLLEAAARFQAIHELHPLPTYLDFFAGETHEERLCRCVIRYAECFFECERALQAAVLARLEAELDAQRGEHGVLTLPPVPPGWAALRAD